VGAVALARPARGPGRALLLQPQKLWRAYQSAYWRPGFVRKTGGPLLARVYYALQRLRG
jgi:hypothetical protein